MRRDLNLIGVSTPDGAFLEILFARARMLEATHDETVHGAMLPRLEYPELLYLYRCCHSRHPLQQIGTPLRDEFMDRLEELRHGPVSHNVASALVTAERNRP